MSPSETRSVVQEFYDQWNAGAIDFESLVHSQVANHQPGRDPEIGLAAFRQAITGVMHAVPDSQWATIRLLADGNFVVCHNVWSGTYGGEVFRGVRTPTGKFAVEHIHIYRVDDGKLAEHWVVRDDLGMLLQTGAISG